MIQRTCSSAAARAAIDRATGAGSARGIELPFRKQERDKSGLGFGGTSSALRVIAEAFARATGIRP